MMKKQVHVFYSGGVQGIGFRFTARDIAVKLGICGWIKNLCNDGVEIIAEADEETLKTFLESIKEYFSDYIANTEIEWKEPAMEFKDFKIRF